MLDVAKTSKCNGCHACFSICPVGAISMNSDNNEFLRPIIDYSKCTHCGKCESVCPVLHTPKLPETDPPAFACKNINEEIRLKSSSGGIFTVLAENIIRQGGVVFGARFDKDFSVIHDWTETIEGLGAFRGSKYVQSKIGSKFIDCKKFLEEGRCVLFSGTPCQIGGLKSYLGIEYNLLYTVDIICHGVPSPLLWRKYLVYHTQKAGSSVQNISFRNKDNGWKKFSLSIQFAETCYNMVVNQDPFMKFFSRHLCLRSSCHCCVYKNVRRVSDFTLADFWGIQNISAKFDDDKGVSLLLLHNNKAIEKFDYVKKNMFIESVPLQLAVQKNPFVCSSVKPSRFYKMCCYDISKHDFIYLHEKYFNDKYFYKLFILFSWYIKKIFIGKRLKSE
ncbi:MAG TPA: 4Fe-4S binding protein [Acholeplasmataceae bacterium]|nr:4Fe-4S binding protein [Acholeplasmataceae bacterium]